MFETGLVWLEDAAYGEQAKFRLGSGDGSEIELSRAVAVHVSNATLLIVNFQVNAL